MILKTAQTTEHTEIHGSELVTQNGPLTCKVIGRSFATSCFRVIPWFNCCFQDDHGVKVELGTVG